MKPLSVLLFCLLSLATPAHGASLTLLWTNNATNATNVEIERKTAPETTYTKIVTVGDTIDIYVDGSAPAATNCYRVRATNATGVSAYSNEACQDVIAPSQVPPAPVLTLTTNLGFPVLTWTAPAEAIGIHIDRKAANTNFVRLADPPANMGLWHDDKAGLTLGGKPIQWCYRARYYNTVDDSKFSTVACTP